MQIKLTTNAIDAAYYFNSVARKQIPFAVSRAINRIAYDARDDEQSLLGNYFDIRTSWLFKKGAMPVVPSRKSQWPNIHAILAVKDPVAALNATGGIRKSEAGGKIAVPMSKAGQGGSTRQILNPGAETLGPKFFPSRILRPGRTYSKGRRTYAGKNKPFVMTSKGRQYIVRREDKERKPLTFLYAFKTGVDVNKNWPLIDNVELHVQRYYQRTLEREFNHAISNPKKA